MIQKIKILLLLNLLLVNTALSKELPGLFEVMIPEDQYTNTNDGLNKAFNLLIQKLSGSRSNFRTRKQGQGKIKLLTTEEGVCKAGKDKRKIIITLYFRLLAYIIFLGHPSSFGPLEPIP